MPKKKNIMSVNFSNKGIYCLQELGFIDGNKRSRGEKSLSRFVNGLVMDFVDLNRPAMSNEVEKKNIIIQLFLKQKERNSLDNDILSLADKLIDLKKIEVK